MRTAAKMIMSLGLTLTGYAGLNFVESLIHSHSSNPSVRKLGEQETKVAEISGAAAIPFIGLALYDSKKNKVIYTNRFHG